MAVQKEIVRRINGISVQLVDGREYSKNGEFSMVLPFNGYLSLPKMTNSAYKGVREDVFRNDKLQTLTNDMLSLQRKLKLGIPQCEPKKGEPDWSYAKMSVEGPSLQPGSIVLLEHTGRPFLSATQKLLLAVMLTGTRDKDTNGLVLQETAEKCLKVAYDKKFQSISFPLEVPHHREVDFEDKAMAFYHAAWNFARKERKLPNPVKNITFYLHNVFDESLVNVAQLYFGNWFPPSKP